jgi:hypothetical protein
MANRRGATKEIVLARGRVATVDGEDSLIERAVRALRAMVVGGQVRILIDAGEYLIEHFYGGAAEARAHNPRKAASLRRLTERAEEFGMTPSGVRRCVPVALQARALGKELSLRLPQDHHLALLPLRSPEEKRVLAESAVEAGWSARDLRRKVAELQPRHPGGRPRRPGVSLFVERLDRLVEGFDASAAAREVGQLSPADRRHLLARIRTAEAGLARVRRALD